MSAREMILHRNAERPALTIRRGGIPRRIPIRVGETYSVLRTRPDNPVGREFPNALRFFETEKRGFRQNEKRADA